MKYLPIIAILSIALTACSNIGHGHRKYCPQETELLECKASIKAVFDFSLSKEQQFESLQQQTEENLCNGNYVIDTRFGLSDTVIETALIIDMYCDPSELTEIRLMAHPIQTIDIYLGAQGQITVDDSIVHMNDLEQRLSKVEWYQSHAAFRIDWHNKSSISERQNLFQSALNGCLLTASKVANERFNKPICELETDEIGSIRRNLKFAFVLGNYLENLPPLSPPPPGVEEYFETKIDEN